MPSAREHPEVVSSYLHREVQLNRMVKLSKDMVTELSPIGLQISPFGVIPKHNRPGKWRLIVNLSAPHGASANDAISQELSSISYTSVDQAADLVKRLGKGCMLAKLDLQEAYRAIPVHPVDQTKLAVSWNGDIYIDRALPFGLRSAPKLFSAVIDALMWILHTRGIQYGLHYLDDFLLLGPANSHLCHQALHTTLSTIAEAGFTVAPDKTEGPAQKLVYLGIEIDTISMELRLPQDKLTRLRAMLCNWLPNGHAIRRSTTKRQLLSLIGLLSHAAKVVRPGRPFIRRLIDASTSVQSLNHHIRLGSPAREDIIWWHILLQCWNGISVILQAGYRYSVVCDASGRWGCGASFSNLWLQFPWPGHWKSVPISQKEMVPVVLALALWGSQWAGSKVLVQSDNMAVVCAINKRSARDPILARLLRLSALFCAVYDITLTASHIPGANNLAADALSRNNLPLFFSVNTQASPMPTVIPSQLIELVFNPSLSSISQKWILLFKSSLNTASHLPLARCTPQPSGASQHSVTPTTLTPRSPSVSSLYAGSWPFLLGKD